MERVKVLIVDDSAEFREALKAFLQAEGSVEVVGEAEDGDEAVEETEKLQPDVVLLDLRMPRVDGLTALKQIRGKAPLTKIVVLSILDERECVREAFNEGASGYIVKDVNESELPAIISETISGKMYVHPLVTNFLLAQLKQAGTEKLNRDEKKILQLVAEGFSDEKISAGLGIEPGEIKSRVKDVLSKLELREKVQEIAVQLRDELLEQA